MSFMSFIVSTPKTAESSYSKTRKLNLILDNLSCLNNICPAKPRGVYKKEESYTIHCQILFSLVRISGQFKKKLSHVNYE